MKRGVRIGSERDEKPDLAKEGSAIMCCTVLMLVSLGSFVNVNTIADPDPVVYVDDDDCFGNTPCYRWVAQGVAGVDSGGTVYIYEGDYPEDTITIDRHVNLIGLNGSEVTKVGDSGGSTTGHTMQIDENLYVNISGLMLQNIFNGARRGINSSSNTVLRVSDCIFQNLYYGIYITDGYLYADSNFFNVTATQYAYQPNSIFVDGGSTSSIIVNNTFKYTKNGWQ